MPSEEDLTRVPRFESAGSVATSMPDESEYWAKQAQLDQEFRSMSRKDRRDSNLASQYGQSRSKSKSTMQLIRELTA